MTATIVRAGRLQTTSKQDQGLWPISVVVKKVDRTDTWKNYKYLFEGDEYE
jgi:hypothetical protein